MGLKTEIARANIIFTGGRFISAAIGFFFSIILARILQPYNFGLYSFCIVIVSFFILFTDLGLNSTLIRFVAKNMKLEERRKVSSIIKSIFKYKIALTMSTGIIVSIFSEQVSLLIFNKPEAGFIVFLAGFVLIGNSLFAFFESLFTGLKKFSILSGIQISQNIFRFIFVIGLVVLGMSVSGAITGLILSYVLMVVASMVIVYKKYNFIVSERETMFDRRDMLTFSAWVFMYSIVNTIYAVIDQLMISAMLPLESVGFYKISNTWAWSIIYLVPIASQVLYPYFSSSTNRDQMKTMFSNSLKYSSIFIFPLAFLLSAFSGPLILFLYKASFTVASEALRIMAFVSIPIVISMILATYFTGAKKPEIIAKILFIMMILNIIFNYFLIQLYGISGAAIATLIAKSTETAILFIIIILVQKLTFKPSILIKPLIASIFMYFVALFFLPNVTNYLTFAIYGVLSLLIYAAIMLVIGGLRKEEFLTIRKLLKF
ncbi:MAG: flippase [Candidatus Aenigmarchaeota archaeon]|nr:flippase [Candidatus Aenigmarchaeota archaeon]